MATTPGPGSAQGRSPFHEYPYGRLFSPNFVRNLPDSPILDKSSPEYRKRCSKVLTTLENDVAKCYRERDSLMREHIEISDKIDQLRWNMRYVYTRGEPLILDPACSLGVWTGYGILIKQVVDLSTKRAICEEQLQVCRAAITHYNKLLSAGVRDVMRSNNEPAFARVQDSWVAAELDALERRQYSDVRCTPPWDQGMSNLIGKLRLSP